MEFLPVNGPFDLFVLLLSSKRPIRLIQRTFSAFITVTWAFPSSSCPQDVHKLLQLSSKVLLPCYLQRFTSAPSFNIKLKHPSEKTDKAACKAVSPLQFT